MNSDQAGVMNGRAVGSVIIIIIINLEAIRGQLSIDSIQKTVIVESSHIIRKVLQCET
jgi:hypothetical protein